MPNDMSHSSTFIKDPLISGLATRTARYCARTADLVGDPGLTVHIAASAMEHLAALQADLEAARLRLSRPSKAELQLVEDDFKPLEARLKSARIDLSNALLRAKPDGPDAFGLRSHGVDVSAPVDDREATPSLEATVRPISACRALIDLEALRPYLSEAALCEAIERHGRSTGCRDVAGVAYASLPGAAHLPCEVI